MAQLTRRNYLQGPLATLAGACTAAKLPAVAAAPTAKRAGFQLSELFGDPAGLDVKTAKQLGVTHVIAGMNLSRGRREEYLKLAHEAKDTWTAAGMTVSGVEGHPVAFERLKLGVEGGDEEIENTKWAIEALSKVGIHVICYNFITDLGWDPNEHESRGTRRRHDRRV